jgi:chromosome segregation ATPase
MMPTTDKLENALAFAASDLHEGDVGAILMQAKVACQTLAAEIERLQCLHAAVEQDRDDKARVIGEQAAELERLREQLESATYALQAWKNESDRLQASRDAYRHVAIEWYSAEGPFPENFADAAVVCDVDTRAEWRSASAGKGDG